MTNWQNRMFRGYLARRPYSKDTYENQLSPSIMILRIPVICWAHASLRRKASHELPAKTSLVFNCLKSSHSLTHTTLTIKSHIKYRVQKIEHNYNQFGTELKPIQNGCKSQLYNNKSVFPRRVLYTWFLDLI